MDFNLKQWRYQQQQQRESDLHQQPSAKFPRLLFDPQQQEQHPSGSPPALSLFVPELTSKLTHLSAYPADSTPTPTRVPKMGSYFSLGQWQELELQALIFRHMLAGAAVPPELLQLVKKSLLKTTYPLPHSAGYYLHHPLQPYTSHYHPPLLQSGYWGRAAMDPEPGRCRRTDGKKWRCSREVVAGQKYCERHVHRGRNRSRKPVEIPTPSGAGSGGGGGGLLKTNTPLAAQPLSAMAGGTHFNLSGHSPSIDLLHLNQRSSESRTEKKFPPETQTVVSDGRVLRRFFDDWPRSLQEPENGGSNASLVTSSTCLSISSPGNPSSDFSLKLSTGGSGDEPSHGHREEGDVERDRLQSNWAAAAAGGWGTNQVVAPMGGPLAEALRSSSTTTSSPKSVLHRLPRSSTSEASYVST